MNMPALFLNQSVYIATQKNYLSSEQEIINQCIANNRQGQEKLYRMFYPALFALCRRLLPGDHEALEALNDGMLKVFKSIHSWKSGQGKFFNWVYTIVRNAAIDKLKNKHNEFTELKEEFEESVNNNTLNEIEWKEIYKLSEALPPASRAVYNLFYLEGFTIKEIANMLELSPGTVKWHLGTSREKIKPILIKHFQQ